ncbi:cysteine hydrolase family protein [Salsuginibacillus kocurii]|uniref:cysteine hydrolase family protein n=1 Tax=Salsuginibacillus kocurii TaxID=427078 RepID=UPI000365C0EA|nr:isochorismatase family cysteine hydrolase [Salsuginibacillus kocurii]
MKALLVIDYTNDFVAEDGALTCGEPGQAIDGYIAEQVDVFVETGDYVVFPTDLHEAEDPYHPETRLFPPHNVRGGEGRALYGRVGLAYDEHQREAGVRQMDKTRYSAFAGTDLDLRLSERGIVELHLVGVCTDICVLHTAVDAYNLGYKLVVHKNGVASFDERGHDWALGHFENVLGAEVL